MSEPVWYYARGEVEKGPLTLAQIKALAAAGKLRRDDFVWKEGMEDWVQASDVADIFGGPEKGKDERTTKSTKPARAGEVKAEQPRYPRKLTAPPTQTEDVVRATGRALFVIGFLVVLVSRGCDSLSLQNVSRLTAVSNSERQQFQSEWDLKRADLEAQLEGLSGQTARDLEARQLAERIKQLDQQMTVKRGSLETGVWRDNQMSAEQASTDHQMWSFWRQVAFLLGTIGLAVGLFGTGFASEGAERWISFIIIAVIVYSLYSGQGVWGNFS